MSRILHLLCIDSTPFKMYVLFVTVSILFSTTPYNLCLLIKYQKVKENMQIFLNIFHKEKHGQHEHQIP